MDSIVIVRNGISPLYVQIYSYFKKAIEKGDIAEGEKLPSIRGLTKVLGVSKSTVEMAYQQLFSEGYIENANRARYTVAFLDRSLLEERTKNINLDSNKFLDPLDSLKIEYDFASGEMDPEGFNFTLWKRYVNKALAETQRLVGYGHVQGEEELREQIVRYLYQSRGVMAHSSQVIIGPGIQSLLVVLCSLLKDKHSSIAFEDPGFKNGRRIFAEHDFQIIPVKMGKDGIDMETLKENKTDLVYLSPSHQFPTGTIRSIGKRIAMLAWAENNQGLIIEDDYDSEFRYYGRPVPALKGLDQRGSVVYLGSFSKIIPPSIRISYMVLPKQLLTFYREKAALYKQGSSTTEQLALALFMKDGQLEKQIRRLRKFYQEKRTIFFKSIKENLGEHVILEEKESGLFTVLTVKTDLTSQELKNRALKVGCRVAAIEDYALFNHDEQGFPRLILYFSSIPKDKINEGVGLLKQAWFQ